MSRLAPKGPSVRPIAVLNVVAAALLAGVIGTRSMQATPVQVDAGGDAARRRPRRQRRHRVRRPEACGTCHTGYEASIRSPKHGQANNERTPAVAFGCESCHGPGEAHVRIPRTSTVQFTSSRPKSRTACATCHNRGPHALWKGSQHESRNLSCVTCHSVHQPKSDKAQLKRSISSSSACPATATR